MLGRVFVGHVMLVISLLSLLLAVLLSSSIISPVQRIQGTSIAFFFAVALSSKHFMFPTIRSGGGLASIVVCYTLAQSL